MNYYAPREIIENGKSAGRWHYTCRNDDHTWAVGYCSPWTECPECHCQPLIHRAGLTESCIRCQGIGLIRKDSPCPGHATPEEACEHQKQYYVDTAHLDGRDSSHQSKCQVCQRWTDRVVTWGPGFMSVVILCADHATPDHLARFVRVGVCTSSC